MRFSFRSLLDQFGDHLYGAIIPNTSVADVRALAALLPPLSGAGVEYHLGTPTSRADVLLRATNADSGREALAGRHHEFAPAPELLHSNDWRPIVRFCEAWGNPASRLYHQVENVWLEFDILPQLISGRVPSLFFDPDRHNREQDAEKLAIVATALTELGQPVSERMSNFISRCLRIAPEPAGLYYLGVMLARRTDAVRLCLNAIAPEDLVSYLRRLEWPGPTEIVERVLLPYACQTTRMILDLDVGSTIHPNLGLELFFETLSDWEQVLSRLISEGLCTPDESQKIMNWPGESRFTDPCLQHYLSGVVGKSVHRLIGRINHLKLSCNSSGEITAKIYFYCAYS